MYCFVFEKVLHSVKDDPFIAISDDAANRLIAAKNHLYEIEKPNYKI